MTHIKTIAGTALLLAIFAVGQYLGPIDDGAQAVADDINDARIAAVAAVKEK